MPTRPPRSLDRDNQRPAVPILLLAPSVKRHTGGTGILTCCPSPTPCGLGLGPTNPGRINLPQETLDFRRTGFSPAFTLLVLTSSLLPPPALLTVHLHRLAECSPTAPRGQKSEVRFKQKNLRNTFKRSYILHSSGFLTFRFLSPENP